MQRDVHLRSAHFQSTRCTPGALEVSRIFLPTVFNLLHLLLNTRRKNRAMSPRMKDGEHILIVIDIPVCYFITQAVENQICLSSNYE